MDSSLKMAGYIKKYATSLQIYENIVQKGMFTYIAPNVTAE